MRGTSHENFLLLLSGFSQFCLTFLQFCLVSCNALLLIIAPFLQGCKFALIRIAKPATLKRQSELLTVDFQSDLLLLEEFEQLVFQREVVAVTEHPFISLWGLCGHFFGVSLLGSCGGTFLDFSVYFQDQIVYGSLSDSKSELFLELCEVKPLILDDLGLLTFCGEKLVLLRVCNRIEYFQCTRVKAGVYICLDLLSFHDYL